MFRQSKHYRQIMRKKKKMDHLMTASKGGKFSDPLTDRAENMISQFQAGEDTAKILKDAKENKPKLDDFSVAAMTFLVDKGFDPYLAEVMRIPGGLLVYFNSDIRSARQNPKSLLSQIADVKLVSTPEDDLRIGCFVYKLKSTGKHTVVSKLGDIPIQKDPMESEMKFKRANQIAPQADTRNKKGQRVLHDQGEELTAENCFHSEGETKREALAAKLPSISAKRFRKGRRVREATQLTLEDLKKVEDKLFLESGYKLGQLVKTDIGVGMITDVTDFGTPAERYQIGFQPVAELDQDVVHTSPVKQHPMRRYKWGPRIWMATDKIQSRAKKEDVEGFEERGNKVAKAVHRLRSKVARVKGEEGAYYHKASQESKKEESIRPSLNDIYVDASTKKPFKVTKMLGNQAKIKGFDQKDTEKSVRVIDIERDVTSGRVVKLTESDDEKVIDFCPNCILKLEASKEESTDSATVYRCKKCGYVAEVCNEEGN